MNEYAIRLEKEDNVIIARRELKKGLVIEEEGVTLLEDIPAGYKIATRSVKKGEMVHNHNDEFDARGVDYAYGADCHPVKLLPPEQRRTFLGIRRADGRVATRNYVGVLVCSNCAATVARKITEHFNEERMKAYPNVDGVVPFIMSWAAAWSNPESLWRCCSGRWQAISATPTWPLPS